MHHLSTVFLKNNHSPYGPKKPCILGEYDLLPCLVRFSSQKRYICFDTWFALTSNYDAKDRKSITKLFALSFTVTITNFFSQSPT